jgi:hypothetical protein
MSSDVLDAQSSRQIVGMFVNTADIAAIESMQNQTALHFASSLGQSDLVFTLLSQGADIEAADSSGATPLPCLLVRAPTHCVSSQ